MNLEKLYQETGGDMAGAVRRLGSASAVERFLRMFAGDDTFAMLQAAMSAGDVQRAFRAAHTLKGLAANLSPDGGPARQRYAARVGAVSGDGRGIPSGVRGDRRAGHGRVENTDFCRKRLDETERK